MSGLLQKKVRIVLTVILFTFSSFVLTAQSKKSDAIVKVGYFENEIFQEGAKPGSIKKGYAYEYYRKISEYTGWNYEYVCGDFIDLYKMLEEGRIDLLAGLAYSEARAEKIFYEDAPMGESHYYLLKKNSNLSVDAEPSSLNDKKIGVLNSAMIKMLENWLTENNINAEAVVYDSYEELFSHFDNNDVDSLMVEGTGIYGRNDCSPFLSIGSTNYYLCVNKNRPDILNALNKAHKQLINDDPYYLNSLYSKYYPKSVFSRVFSAEESQYIDTHSSITIGYLNNYLPYCTTDSNGNLKGFLKDLIPELFDELGVSQKLNVTYKPYENFFEMVTDLDDTKIDVAFPVGGGLYFSEKGGFYQSQAVISATVALVYNGDFEKIQTSRFAVNKNNGMQYYYVKSNFPDAVINNYNSVNECLDSIVSGESDFVTINGLRVTNLLKNSKYNKLNYRLLSVPDERSFGVKIGNESLLRIINRGINAVGEQYILNQAYPYTDELHEFTFADYAKNVLYILIPLILVGALIIIIYNYSTKTKLRILNIKLEAALKNRERYIADMIRYASSEGDADKILNQLVEYIGKNTNSDRVYVFEINSKSNFDNTYEWCNKGITKEIDNLQDIPYEGIMELWMNEFKNRGNVTIKDIEEYKEISLPIYEILKPQNIQTLVAIPLKVNGKIIGFVGVDNPPVIEMDDVSEFLKLVEFFFALMIRIRNGVISLADIASHDQLTGFYNRRAYQEEKDMYKLKGLDESFVYVSIDINGLKVANDTIGHEAGDELIIGACNCMQECLGPYGKLYRVGGDEFIAFIHASDSELEQIKQKLQSACDNWSGKLVEHMALSCGYVSAKENPELSLHEISVLADKRMYEAKSNYYRMRGVDRRGQKDAHIALCALYTKILKINITDDTYQIINMDAKEQTRESGFADKISDWLINFAKSGQVHTEDLEDFLAKTDLEYMRKYFIENNSALRIFYRRKYKDDYKRVMMEIIPSNDYTNENQNLFLYVKDID